MYRKSLLYLFLFLLAGTQFVIAQPIANFTIDPTSSTSGCPPHSAKFKNLSTGATSYLWEFSVSGPNTSTLTDPSWVFYNPGQYTVKLTAYNGSQNNTVTKTLYITVYDTAKVDFSSSATNGCAPLTINYSNLTTPLSGNTYQWVLQGGNPSTVTGTTASANYTAAGTYLVTLKATTSHGCISSKTRQNYITIKPKPTVGFTGAPLIFCGTTGKVDTFKSTVTGGTGPFTYSWSFGSIVANPVNIPFTSPPASHNVKLVVTDANGCKDSLTEPNYVKFIDPVADFQAPSSVCVYSPVTFVNKTTPCVTNAWWNFDYPNGVTSISPNPIYAYTTPGVKTVKMVTWCGDCPDTVTKTIVVHDLPKVDFVSKPDSPCPAPIAIQYIPNGTYSTYSWTFGSLAATGPGTSATASPIRNYTANGFDTVTLTVTDANGCTNAITKEPGVKIFDHDWLFFDERKDTLCAPINYRATIVHYCKMNEDGYIDGIPHVYPWGYKDVTWTDHNGSQQYTDTFKYTYTYADSFRLKAVITTNNNCVFADSIKVPIGTKPLVSNTAPFRICRRDSIFLLNTAPYPHNEYRWDYGDGTTPGRGKDGFHQYDKPGTYTISHTNFYNQCPSDTIYHTVLVDSPRAIADIQFFCHKDSLRYIKVRDKSLGSDSTIWLFGDGQISNARDTIHKYPAIGTYILKLVAYNKTSNCWDTTRESVINIFDAQVNVVANDTAICLDDWVHFDAITTGFVPYGYAWFIDGNILNPSWDYNLPTLDTPFHTKGFHTIKLMVQDEHICLHTINKNNYIFVTRPAVAISGNPLTGCVPLTVTLTDQSTVPTGATIAHRLWSLPGGSPFTSSTTSATTSSVYLSSGAYPVKVVVTDNVGCKDSLEYQGYIGAFKPIAGFTVSDTGCLNTPLTFTNNSLDFNSSLWDFSNGTSGAPNPSRSFNALGSYDITLIVSDHLGCKDTARKKLAITKPYPAFTVSDSVAVCQPFIVTFTNASTGPNAGNYTYAWDFGNGTGVGPNPVNAYLTPGVYNVTMVATTPWGCQDSAKSVIRLYGYSGSLTYFPKVGCVPLEVTMAPVSLYNIPKLTWDFTDGNILVTTVLDTVKHIYQTSGKYLPKLILEDMNGCKTTSEGLDSIVVDETFADFITGPACEYGPMNFFDQSKGKYTSITGWQWTFDTSGTSILKDPTHGYGPAGQYLVKLAVKSANQCKDTIEKMVTVHPLPNIDAGPDTIICLKDSALLLPQGGVSYKWTPATYLDCDTCAHPLASPPKQFVFTVVGTDANGCKNKDTVTVKIKTKVTAFVGPGTEICDMDTFTMHAWGAKTYEWTPAESLNNSRSATPIASPHTTTNYTVVAYEGRCIPDTHNVNVIVHPLPTVKAEGSTTIVSGNTADLRSSGSLIKRFEWTPAEDLTCSDCAYPTAKPSQTTVYTVKVYTDFGCVDSDQVTITVLCDQSQLFIPNTFTPNGDGQNDVFYPRGEGMEKVRSFRIYNRWGELVFERNGFNLNDQFTGWDGTFKGNQLSPDVFVWVLEALCDDGKVLTLKGDVTIIR